MLQKSQEDRKVRALQFLVNRLTKHFYNNCLGTKADKRGAKKAKSQAAVPQPKKKKEETTAAKKGSKEEKKEEAKKDDKKGEDGMFSLLANII